MAPSRPANAQMRDPAGGVKLPVVRVDPLPTVVVGFGLGAAASMARATLWPQSDANPELLLRTSDQRPRRRRKRDTQLSRCCRGAGQPVGVRVVRVILNVGHRSRLRRLDKNGIGRKALPDQRGVDRLTNLRAEPRKRASETHFTYSPLGWPRPW